MKYGILGSGDVARAIGEKLLGLGNEVMLSSRKENADLARFAKDKGALCGDFAGASEFGECVFLCVRGIYAIDALKAAGVENLAGKILIDLTNPYIYQNAHIFLDSAFSGENGSLGEAVQRFCPQSKVVKTLNYITNSPMVAPKRLNATPTGFYCGNDSEAKAFVAGILKDFGWEDRLDLGDISMSRYTEMLGAFWVPAFNALKTMGFGVYLAR